MYTAWQSTVWFDAAQLQARRIMLHLNLNLRLPNAWTFCLTMTACMQHTQLMNMMLGRTRGTHDLTGAVDWQGCDCDDNVVTEVQSINKGPEFQGVVGASEDQYQQIQRKFPR